MGTKIATKISGVNKFNTFWALGKVIFEFDRIFWDNSKDRFQIIADHTDGDLSRIDRVTETIYISLVCCKFCVHNGKASLVILTQAPLTNYLETHPDQAWQYYQPMLQKLSINDEPIPDPINTQSPIGQRTHISVALIQQCTPTMIQVI